MICAGDEDYLDDADNREDDVQTRNAIYDELLLQRLKASLSGVPPPPVLTMPQQKIEEILDVWKNSLETAIPDETSSSSSYHAQIVDFFLNNFFKQYFFSKIDVDLLRINCSMQKALDSEWPEAKCCVYFDIRWVLNFL